MSSIKHKLIAALLAMALLAGSLSVLAPSYPARALIPTAETISIPMVLFQGVLKAVEGGLYVVLRKFVQKYVKDLTKSTANYLFKGGRGKGPAYEIRPWDNFWQEVGDEAAGAALEGLVQGSVNEYEAQKKETELVKSLKDTGAQAQNLSFNAIDLENELSSCNKKLDEIDPTDNAGFHAQYAKCEEAKIKIVEKGDEIKAFHEKNDGKLSALKKIKNEPARIQAQQNELQGRRDEEKAACDPNVVPPGDPRSANCRAKRQAVIDQVTMMNTENKESSAEFAAIDKESSDAYKAIYKKKIEDDEKLVTGQTGALSEVGRTIVDIVCKPEADFALKIFLGLGADISQTKRKSICPLDVSKIWSRVITGAAFEHGGYLSEQTIDAWQNLAALVNPETSDLGVAWKLSVSGHDAKEIVRQLGVTEYDQLSALGGIKGVTNLAGTVITTPAKLVGEAVDKTIEAPFEGATRFVPTGHIVADLIITAGAAFLETTLDLVKDGLRKRQVTRRQSKEPNLAGLRPFVKSTLYSPDSDPNAGTEAFAEATLAVFDQLKYDSVDSWDVLNKITATGEGALCYNPGIDGVASLEQKAADPESCSIDEDFSRAIREEMTVQQAINKKLLDRNGVFGFDTFSGKPDIQPSSGKPDIQPSVSSSTKHYPYNSLVILRKYRIIPVSWELAALYINESYKNGKRLCRDADNCRLGDLIDQFDKPDKPFYQMVDPNWVLKAPPTKCKLKGYGPQVIREIETVKDRSTTGEKEIQNVRGETCVDHQTCLGQKANGTCERGFGYCLKEEAIAHFTGEKCEQIHDGCRSFTDSVTKQPLTVIADSLTDYKKGICTTENAGCAWYSTARNFEWNDPTSTPPDTRYRLDANNASKIYTSVTRAGLTRREWSSDTTNRVFFASSAKKCEPQAEGCREVSGPSGTPQYLRLPPNSLSCATDGVQDGKPIQWYKRQECKKYTQLCKEAYVGCERYMPQDEEFAVTGKSPDDSLESDPLKRYTYRCPAACANIYNYVEQKTLFEPLGNPTTPVARTIYFNAATAQKCSVADVGCEEFTNLDEVARGGEGKDYFTYLQRCVKEANPESIPANEVFYHFVGSDTAGGQPEKHYVVGDGTPGADGYKPKCADGTNSCDCSVETAEKSKNDPRVGANPCREFINANGKPFYRYAAELIYRTPDCTSYRRTIEDQAGVAKTYSPSLSHRCSSAAAVNCREYHAPQAGNVRVLRDPDNFETGSPSDHWLSTNQAAALSLSNEGEIIGDHSMKVVVSNISGGIYLVRKDLALKKGGIYSLSLVGRGDLSNDASDDTALSLYLGTISDSGAVTAVSNTETIPKFFLTPRWQQFKATFTVPENATTVPNALIVYITKVSSNTAKNLTFYLDDSIIREVAGIEYVIRDSWVENREARCFNETAPQANPPNHTPNWDSPAYSGCSLYTDRQGTQQAIRSFERICPNEMAGCVQVTVKNGKIFEKAGDPDDKKKLVDSDPMYIIPDAAKACQASDNKCTAYGSPKLLTRTDGTEELKTSENKASDESLNEWKYKEEWNIAYFKVTPEEAQAGQNRFVAGDTSPYESGICRAPTYETVNGITKVKEDSTTHKKILGDLGCRAYTPSGGGETYFRDPGKSVCEFSPSGDHWFYYACDRSSRTPDLADDIVCTTDDDCPVTGGIKEKCNISKEIVDSSTANTSAKGCRKENARKCPADKIGCRKITDPNCIDRGNNKFTLENNYGRTSGTTDSGISCEREYYFTEDFNTRTKECNGQVNPGAGCLLFKDEKLERPEYHIMKNCETTTATQCTEDTDCPLKSGSTTDREKCNNPLAIPQNDTTNVPHPRNYCSCDRVTDVDSDCSEKEGALSSDLDYCYNRYYNPAATGEKNLLRKYKKVSAEAHYNSGGLYTAANANGGATNATAVATGDANTLIKVRPDRQCNVWLECATYFYSGAEKICTRRVPCDKGTPGVSCTHRLEDAAAPSYLDRFLEDDVTAATDAIKKAPRKELLTLSGFARPDYKFVNAGYPTAMTTGGYSAHFSKLQRTNLPDSADRTARGRNIPSDLSYNRVVPQATGTTREDSLEFVCTNDLARACKTATTGVDDCPPIAVGQPKGGCVSNPGFLNACRLYPRESAPDLLHNPEHKKGEPARIVDACQPSDTGSGGIYGYCLEPNPLFRTEYSSATPYPHLDVDPTKSKKGVCRDSYGSTCNKDSDCQGATGPCVYRYYENYCLNWLPVDRTGLETLFTKNDVTPYTAYNPQNRLSYCVKTDTKLPAGKPGDFPQKIGEHKVTKDFYYAADTTFDARNSSGVYKVNDCDTALLPPFVNVGNPIAIKFETNPGWPSKFNYDDQCWKNSSKGQEGKKSPREWQEVRPDMLIFPMTTPLQLDGIVAPPNKNEKYPDGPLKGEGYHAEHIDNIKYTFEASGFLSKNYHNFLGSSTFGADEVDNIILSKEETSSNASKGFEATFIDFAGFNKPTHASIAGISAFSGCDSGLYTYTPNRPPPIIRGYFSIRANFSGTNGAFNGWEVKQCGYTFFLTMFNRHYADVIFMSVKITTTSKHNISDKLIHTDDVNVSFKDDFCSEFVTVAKDGKAVADVSDPDKPARPTTAIPISCDPSNTTGYGNPPTLKYLETKCTSGANGQTRNNVSTDYLAFNRKQVCHAVNTTDHSTVQWLSSGYNHCTLNSENFSQWDHIDSPANTIKETFESTSCVKDPSSQADLQCLLKDDILLPIVPNLTDIINNNALSDTDRINDVRSRIPFRKIYEYWRWDGSKYTKIYDIDGEGGKPPGPLEAFWNKTKNDGKTNRPRIYNDNDQEDRFDGDSTDANEFELSFFVDVKDSQLPIRNYKVTLPYNHEIVNEIPRFGDGHGPTDNFDGYGTGHTRKDPNTVRKFGPLHESYNPTSQPLKRQSDLKACVEVTDNWGACTRLCGTLDTNGHMDQSSSAWPDVDCSR